MTGPEPVARRGPADLLVLIGSLEVGGAERHLALVLPELDRALVRPEIYCLSHRGTLADALEAGGVPVHAPARAAGGRRAFAARVAALGLRVVRLLAHLVRRRPRIVHFYLPESYIVGSLCAILARVPLRVMSRRSLGLYQQRRPLLGKLERRLHPYVDLATGNSRAVLAELEAEGFAPGRLRLLYNGVARHAPREGARKAVRAELAVASDALVLICVANLIPYKGHADLLRALGTIRIERDWSLWCVGRDDGPGAALREQAGRAGIGDRVRWLGARSDVPDLLAGADVAISSSHEEGFSNAVLEAMAAGLPVIATDAGGNAEAVLDGVTGLVVPVRDADAMASAIARLAGDAGARRAMGDAGRRRADESFSVARCVAGYEQLYRELLDGRAASPRESS